MQFDTLSVSLEAHIATVRLNDVQHGKEGAELQGLRERLRYCRTQLTI